MLRSQITPFDGGTASVVSGGKTYLKGLMMIYALDFDDYYDDLEYRWQAKKRSTTDNHVLRYTQHNMVMSDHEYFAPYEFELIDRIRDGSGYIWIKLLEDDGGWGVDDYGEYYLTDESTNWYYNSWADPRFSGGGSRCDFTTVNGYFYCPVTKSWGAFWWK